jgi:hypothetical protein
MKQILGFLLILTCSSVCFGKVFLHYDFTNADENKDFKVDRMHPDDPAKNAYSIKIKSYLNLQYLYHYTHTNPLLPPVISLQFFIYLVSPPDGYITNDYGVYLSGNSHILIPMNEFEKKNNFGIFLKYQFNMYIDATYLVYETVNSFWITSFHLNKLFFMISFSSKVIVLL